MATVVLQVVGAAIGGAIGGPVGAAIGRAVGAAAGYSIDQKLFSQDHVIRGGRLEDSRFIGIQDGTPIPRAYGRVRLGGQLIWATRFEERRKKKKSGGKGGGGESTSVSYTYYGNFAIGICEGDIAYIGRIWADGKELDQRDFTIRKYLGDEGQIPDPLIEAKQGFGNAPSFRGTAYVVFESFPLADYGNRIPQVSFEVVRPIGKLEKQIRSVCIIPGATEFGYFPEEKRSGKKGKTTVENRNTYVAGSDWEASLNELQALCPNLESVSLVTTWFGSDLRASQCIFQPKTIHKDLSRTPWSVSGVTRVTSELVTEHNGNVAYGGSPSDASIVAAIKDLKSRGLKVILNPFVMMDIPHENNLPSPYENTTQPPYPWRGRITVSPAIGQDSSADQTSEATTQINALLGSVSSSDFSVVGENVEFTGEENWGYRRMILHYAHLCQHAGGVDAFLIGSELRGLTKVRNEQDQFPFVDGLVQLAADCRMILDASTKITYAADWSEYFGYHPGNETNDVYFNLDPLWSSPAIDAIGIDNYMPLANWSLDGDPTKPNAKSGKSIEYLQSNILGGEGFDWFYANADHRFSQIQTEITDGQGENWIWSYKNLPAWWSEYHHNRVNGVRSTTSTDWEPGSKPIWFCELGCSAIDRGANQPNVFFDAKSDESDLPWFSVGSRDDLMQRRFNEAHLSFWQSDEISGSVSNPVSSNYGAPMVSSSDISLWAWDTRPYPAFPHHQDLWSDGLNWYRGHWLNGRLGGCPLDDLIEAVFLDFDLQAPSCQLDGYVEGFVVSGETTPRAALEPLLNLHHVSVVEEGETISFRGKDYCDHVSLSPDELVQENEETKISRLRQSEIELPKETILSHADIEANFDSVTSISRRLETVSDRQVKMELSAVLSKDKARDLVSARLRDYWLARDGVKLQLPWKHLSLGVGDTFDLGQASKFQINTITDGLNREIEASGFSKFEEATPWIAPSNILADSATNKGAPEVLLLNLPLAQNQIDPQPRIYAAVDALPWRNEYAVFASPTETGFQRVGSVSEPATVFEVLEAVSFQPTGRWDRASELLVQLNRSDSEFESIESQLLFAGANALAIQTSSGGWEILQFQAAELIADKTWRLTKLLRGQLGTDWEASSGIPKGAQGLVIDDALVPIPQLQSQVGLPLNWRIGPVGSDIGSNDFVHLTETCLGISGRPLSPCHLRSIKEASSRKFSWIRRSRVNSDSWDGAEVPSDTDLLRYQIRISDADGETVRTETVETEEFQYPDTICVSDFGSLDTPYRVFVAQLSNSMTPGPEVELLVKV